MFDNFLLDFNKLPLSNKSMVYLMWIYNFGLVISSIFINIYVFNLFNSINYVIFYNIILFTGCVVGFFGIGLFMSIFEKNIKNMYYLGYLFFILSFLFLLIFSKENFLIFIFAFSFGIGEGLFWCGVHAQELKNIEDKNRDFYSSSISAGSEIIKIICPILIAGVFFLGNIIKFNSYLILFLALPLVYLISFLFIKNINDYIPKKTSRKDFKDFFNFKKYKYGHLYFLLSGTLDILITVSIPILSIYFLKTEENVGLFTGVMTLIGTLFVIYLSDKRQENNRFKYFLIISIIYALNFIFLGAFFGTLIFIAFSLLIVLLSPNLEVSWHVYNLHMMDSIKTENNDFYPSMILREVLLWIGRVGTLLIVLGIIYYFNLGIKDVLKILIFGVSLTQLFFMASVFFWEKHEKNIL